MDDPDLKAPINLLRGFSQVEAVGLSGSSTRGVKDSWSDTDLCVFVSGPIPIIQNRQDYYTSQGVSDIKYLDGDLEVSRIDGLNLAGETYDFLWMSLSETRSHLVVLETDFDSDEYLAGGLQGTRALYDPAGHIQALQGLVPEYTDERALHRVRNHLEKAHFSIFGLDWARKASARNDTFSYSFNLNVVVDHFVSALLALNRKWRCHEKRILQQIDELSLGPHNASARVNSVLLFKDADRDLVVNSDHVKQLFAELSSLAMDVFPDLELPAFPT